MRHVPHRHLTNVNIVSDASGYIFELARSGKIVAYLNDCSGAEGLKVDGAGNLWVACTNTGTVNMYHPGAKTATLTLNASPQSATVSYYTGDVAVDPSGNVYAANLYAFSCVTGCVYLPGNVVYWTAADVKNGARPSGVVNDADLNGQADFLDVDAAGNVYVDYYGCQPGVLNCGNGLDGIASPQAQNPVVTVLIDPTSDIIGYPGGVYTTSGGTELNVLDQASRKILYGAANPASFVQTGLWGPTPQSVQQSCDPVSMGWNKTETLVYVADSECRALDIGTIPHNKFSAHPSIDFALPIGAGTTPSDK